MPVHQLVADFLARSPRIFELRVRALRPLALAAVGAAASAFLPAGLAFFLPAFFGGNGDAFFSFFSAGLAAASFSALANFGVQAEAFSPWRLRIVATVADGLAPTDSQYLARSKFSRTGSLVDSGS